MRFSALTTFGLGGPIKTYEAVTTPEALIDAWQRARANGSRVVLVAGGSNIVAADKAFGGVVIHYERAAGGITVSDSEPVVECEAGVSLGALIRQAIHHGLGGLEALSGIPGTVGGAVVGNAGAYGQCISDELMAVEIFDGRRRRWLKKAEARFAYRESIFKHKSWLVLRAKFRLERADGAALHKRSEEIIAIRAARYKPGLACPGSFFKNVLVSEVTQKSLAKVDASKIIDGKIPAGWLLEQVGARGLRQGDIRIADFHGNLLINDDAGTFADVKKLARRLKERVRRHFGIELEEEIRYVP